MPRDSERIALAPFKNERTRAELLSRFAGPKSPEILFSAQKTVKDSVAASPKRKLCLHLCMMTPME